MSNNEVTRRTRALRKNATPQERRLWEILRNRKFHGLKFYRQKPFFFNEYKDRRYYIADFYCAEKMVILELDGRHHLSQQEYDQLRDSRLEGIKGIRVMRINNRELTDMNSLLRRIEDFIGL